MSAPADFKVRIFAHTIDQPAKPNENPKQIDQVRVSYVGPDGRRDVDSRKARGLAAALAHLGPGRQGISQTASFAQGGGLIVTITKRSAPDQVRRSR